MSNKSGAIGPIGATGPMGPPLTGYTPPVASISGCTGIATVFSPILHKSFDELGANAHAEFYKKGDIYIDIEDVKEVSDQIIKVLLNENYESLPTLQLSCKTSLQFTQINLISIYEIKINNNSEIVFEYNKQELKHWNIDPKALEKLEELEKAVNERYQKLKSFL